MKAHGALLIAVLFGLVAGCQTVARTTPPEATATLPRPETAVTDAAGVLSPEDRASLEADLASIRKRGLAGVIIYIAPALPPGADMEELTLRSANAWGLGRRGRDDGLAIFVFIVDRKVRIEVGRGLEKAVSDEAAVHVISDQLAPAFRALAYGEGLRDAVSALTGLLEKAR